MAVRVGQRRGRASFAAALVVMVGLAVIGGPATSAVAGPGDSSTATARFLSGQILGLNLDGLVSLGGAGAANAGSSTTVVDPAGLDVAALGLLRVVVPSGVQVPLTDVLRLGVVNQYAGAADDGVSRAASGAVGDDGAVSTNGSAAFPANATFDLQDLLGSTITGQVADLQLSFGAITGVAAVDAALGTPPAASCTSLSNPVHCRGYSIAGGTLTLTSPAVAGVATLLTGPGGVSSKVDAAVAALSGPGGLLAQALATVTGVAGLVGSSGVSATVTTTTNAALTTLLTTPIASPSGAVSVNLSTGVITANLDQLLRDAGGSGLSSLAPGTELLSAAVLSTLTTQVSGVLNTVPSRVGAVLDTALNAAQVDISANVCVLGAPCPTNPLTAVAAEVHGTVAQVVAGTAPTSVAVRIGGLGVTVQPGALLGALAVPLSGTLLALSGSTIPAVTTGVTGIVGALSPVLRGLDSVVGLTGNVQEASGAGGFREVALRARLLGGAAGTIDLGRAEVGPNVAAADPVPPTVLSATPTGGPAAGGTTVSVTGSGFVSGATTVTIGGLTVPATAVTVTAPDALSFATPAHAPGAVDLTVTNPAGSATLVAGFAYYPVPAPVIDGPVGGSTVTTATPTFTATGVAGTVTVSEGTVALCTATVAAGTWSCVSGVALANGSHTVTAVQTDTAGNVSGASLPVTFQVAAPAVITGITPDTGPVTGGGTVTLTGSGFEPGSVVLVDGTPATGVVVTGTTTVSYTAPAHPAGPVDVVVVTGGGTSLPATYTYLAAPTLTGLDPTSGPVAGGQTVTVTGTGFTPGAVVVVDGVSVAAASVTPSTLTFVTPPHPAGPVDVTVTTAGGTSGPLGYTYLAPPTVAALDPISGPVAGGQTVTVTGTGFVPGAVVLVDGTPVASADVTPTTLTFVTPAHAAGPVDVVVTTPGGASGPLGYTYLDTPAAASLDPTSGPVTGGQTVTVTGAGFVTGATSVTIGGVPVGAGSVSVTSATTLTFVTPAHPAGPVTVTTTTAGGTSGPLDYTYVAAPIAASLNPTSGPVTGGQTVTVSGSGFVAGATSLTVDGLPVTPTVTSPSTLTFVTPAHPAGVVDVVVTTAGGNTAALPYRYLPVPAAESLDPTSGPTTGGQTVTVLGSGFVAGATSVSIGGTVVVPTVGSATSLTFTTPVHTAGPVDVTVTTLGGTSGPLAYTYVAAPSAVSLDPTSGPTTGGQTVTLTGAGFVAGATAVTVDGLPVVATVTSSTTLTFPTPAHAAGVVDVVATTAGGNTGALPYRYVPVPTAASLDPTSGPTVGGQTVTVSGTGFVAGATVVTVDGTVVVPSVDSATSLTFLTPAHPAGAVLVTVATAGGTSGPLGYTYLAAPTAGSLDPDSGPVLGGQIVTVTGTGFVPGSTTVSVGGSVVVPTVDDETSLTFTTPAHAAGPVDVTVTTPGGTSAPLGYTYLAVPTAGSLDPTSGPAAGGQTVTVSGTGFVPGATAVNVDGTAVDATVISATLLTFSTPAHPVGPVDVTVTTQGGTSAPLDYTYLAVPTAGSLDPTSGPAAAGQTVTVSGTGFVTGATTVTVDGIVVTPTVVSDTTLTFSTPAHPAGTVDVVAITAGGSTGALAYTYVTAPTGASLDPTSGPAAGGQTVTLTGAGFIAGATTVTIGGNPATDVTVTSPTTLTFLTPAHPAGPVEVTATTAGGVTDPLDYVYLAVPTAAVLDPTSGPAAGGQTVVVVGTGFVPGATTVTIGGVAVDPAVVSAAVLTFVTPAHAAGPVSVTVTTGGGTSDPLAYTYVAAPAAVDLDPASGPVTGGQTVTVTGTGFIPGATTVTVDGAVVVPTVISAAVLTFTTPAHPAGVVGVTVTTIGGTSGPLGYEYLAAPTAASLDPTAGPVTGGQTVTVTGSGFVPDATVVSIDGITVGTLVTSPTTLTFTTPAHPAGVVDVVTTTAGGSTGPLLYVYVAAPTVASLDPTSGPEAGGQTVTVTGTGFVAGATSVSIGGNAATDVVVTSPATLTFTTPAHPAGVVDVVATTAGGSSAALPYRYLPVPTAASLDPVSGPEVGGQTVTVTGTGFVAGATAVSVDGVVVTPTVDSATSLTFTTPAHPAGPVDVTVTTLGGTTAPLDYTYVAAPVATGLDPDAGPITGGQTVTVTGTGFVAGATTVAIGGNAATGVTVTSATTLTFVTPAHPAGPVDVTVTTAGGTGGPLGYDYLAVPTAASLNPTSGPEVGGQTVTVTGTGFVPGATTVSVDGVAVDATVVGDSSLTFVTPAHAAATVDVVVITAGGSTGALPYTYVAAPTAASLDPTSGPIVGGQTVTVTGTGFVAGATTVSVDGNPATGVIVGSPTTLTFTTPAHPAGAVAVTVTTAGGSAGPLTYVYLPAPTAGSLDPTSGPVTGGQSVVISGSGFVAGATSVAIGGAVVTPTVVSATLLTFVTPTHPAGPVDVTVTTPGGTSAPLGYTYLAAPVAADLAPTSGPVTGGQTVTVTGSGFVPGASTLTIGGAVVTPTVVSATLLTFVTPAHPVGPVDVTVSTAGGTSAPLGYTYLAAPTAGSLNPTSGPAVGGQLVTVTGTGFVPGATSVTIGGTAVVPTVVSATVLTFTTPAHVAGSVDVTTTTPGGTSAPQGYTYLAAPVAADLAPTSGPVTGGQTVTVTGTGFVAGATSLIIGGTPVVPTVASATLLTFTTPAHPAGPVDVTVTTAGGTSAALGYTYLPAPTAGSLDPTAGPAAGGQTVTVTGTGFVPGTTVTIGGEPAAGVVVTSPTTATFTTPAHAAGPVSVTVTTPGGTSTPALTYTYVAAPAVTGLDPATGPVAGGQTVTVTGSGFVAGGTSVSIGGTAGTAVIVTSPTSLTFVTPAHPAGPVTVTATTIGGTSAGQTYTYRAAPSVTGIDPTHGPLVGGTTVTVTGTGFTNGPVVVTFEELPVAATVVSDTTLTFVTPAGTLAGPPVNVAVSIAGATPVVAGQFSYDAPTIDASSPVVPGASSTVTGAGWPALDQVTLQLVDADGIDVPGATVTVVTTATGQLPAGTQVPVPTGTALGSHRMTAADEDGNTATDAVEIVAGGPVSPVLSTLTPDHGPLAGGTTVTVTGTGFTDATTVVFGGVTIVPSSVTGTTLTFTVPAGTTAGPVDVQVGNGGTAVSGTLQYTYDAPVVTATGPATGGTTTPVTGTGFVPRSPVTVVLVDGDGDPVGDPVVVVTDGTGGFTIDLPVPNVTPGTYAVVAIDGNGNAGTAGLTVVAPAVVTPGVTLTLAFDRFDEGSSQINTVYGTGFLAGVPVSLVVDGSGRELGPVIPGVDGTFAQLFTVSDLGAGTHTVTATQIAPDGTVLSAVVDLTTLAAAANGGGTGAGAGGSGGGSGLAYTGTTVGDLLPIALLMLLAGAFLAFGGRRRWGR